MLTVLSLICAIAGITFVVFGISKCFAARTADRDGNLYDWADGVLSALFNFAAALLFLWLAYKAWGWAHGGL